MHNVFDQADNMAIFRPTRSTAAHWLYRLSGGLYAYGRGSSSAASSLVVLPSSLVASTSTSPPEEDHAPADDRHERVHPFLPGKEPGGSLIDARHLFAARAQASAMEAVASAAVDYDTPSSPERIHRVAAAPQTLTLEGEAVALWYRVDARALAAHLGQAPFKLFGKAIFGVCVGHFKLSPESGSALRPRDSGPELGDDVMTEVTLTALVQGTRGPTLCQVGRLVDASPGGALRELAHGRPRELAYMRFDRAPTWWEIYALWRSGDERLELKVHPHRWLNHLTLGSMLLRAFQARKLSIPLGGGRAHLDPDVPGLMQVGVLEQIHLPDRVHLGLLSEQQMACPDLVTLLPMLRVEVITGRSGIH